MCLYCDVVNVCDVCECWVDIGIAVLFIFRTRLLLYYIGSGVNRVHVVLSGFSVRLL